MAKMPKIKIGIDIESLNQLVKLDCENEKCRFYIKYPDSILSYCILKHIKISENGECLLQEK